MDKKYEDITGDCNGTLIADPLVMDLMRELGSVTNTTSGMVSAAIYLACRDVL